MAAAEQAPTPTEALRAIIGGFFLQPTAKALGTAGQPFMDHLMKRRGMGLFFPIVAACTAAITPALVPP